MHAWQAIDQYAQNHPRWFESAERHVPTGEHLGVYSERIPAAWTLRRHNIWYIATPPGATLRDQGWKIHVSVRSSDSVDALRRALPVLRDAAVPFKFLVDPSVVAWMNGKGQARGSSGKFITVYPCCDQQFRRLGDQLAEELRGFVGPYILSDRRWPGSAPVYYRYGGFRAQSLLQVDGTRVPVIGSPDGSWIPDRRNPYWSPPDWASDPFPAETPSDQAGPVMLDKGRFRIVSALNFTNRGGVYIARDTAADRDVVIKEARPHIEIGSRRIDSITLLEKEYRLLTLLADTGHFVQPVKFFREWEHAFLVEELVTGGHLGRLAIRRNPLYSGDITAETVGDYLDGMRPLWLQIAQAIAVAHERGVVLGDLSLANVMVNEDLRVQICDLEAATEHDVDVHVGLHTPGFSLARISAQANDYYALGAIMFGSLVVANGIVGFYPPARAGFLQELAQDLMLPRALIGLVDDLMDPSGSALPDPDTLIHTIERLPIGAGRACVSSPRLELPPLQRLDADSYVRLRDCATQTLAGIVSYLRNTADVTREDRLFPADLSVFKTNPLSVAYGAAGVVYALKRLSGDVPEDIMAWMLRRQVSNEQYPPGLYVGQAGIAWVFHELGYPDVAIEIMRSARRHDLLWKSMNVLHGAAGYGLACLKLWKAGAGDDFLDEAVRVGNHLIRTCVRDSRGIYWPDEQGSVQLGYANGGSGISLFLLYLHLATGEVSTLRRSRQALDFELAQGVWRDGKLAGFPAALVLTAGEPIASRVLRCYWDAGSAGVGTALVRHLAVTAEETLQSWLTELVADAGRKYTVFPQLFHGLSGLGNFLLDAWEQTGDASHLAEAWQVAEGVLLFRIDRDEGVTFPGEQARRESADFGTGAAGVGLFLQRLLQAKAAPRGNFNFVVDELLPANEVSIADVGA